MRVPFQRDPGSVEVLDLRHYSAAQLRPLLRDECERWNRLLHWNYGRAADLLLEYLDGRILPGFVAVQDRRILGYSFAVFEATKAVIGDVYAFGESLTTANPVCEQLLLHQVEMLQVTPGVDRIETQLLLFPRGSLHGPLLDTGFQSSPRLFMLWNLREAAPLPAPAAPAETQFRLESWRPEFYAAAASLIHRAYQGHMDSGINDQYQTVHGADRFLHNIIRFPGCGQFDPEHSMVLRDRRTNVLVALLLCSRVHADASHITQLCVDPAARQQGLGKMLLTECARGIARTGVKYLSLTVTEANTPALALYQDLGFTTQHAFEAMIWDKGKVGRSLV